MTAAAGHKFVLRIDRVTMDVAGWPAPRHCGDAIVAVSGHLAEDGQPTGDAHARVAAAYGEDGPALSRNLLGQYCAVLVDRRMRRIILTQDSLGLGKLFYSLSEAELVVASDLDLLLAVSGERPIAEAYFAFYIGAAAADRALTPFEGVHRLAYGWTIELNGDSLIRHRPWRPPETGAAGSGEDAEERLRALLSEAVEAALPADGAVVCELTGGLDSTSVFTTAYARAGDLQAMTYVARRGMVGDDELFAEQVIALRPTPWHRVDMDVDELLPDDYGGFVSEPHAILYARQFSAMERSLRTADARVLLTGAVGDVIFEYGGIAPAFLADPLAAGSILGAVRLARQWADERENHRSWLHFLTQLALPIARRHRRGKSVLDWQKRVVPDWVAEPLRRRYDLDRHDPQAQSPRVAEPGRQHLWESVYDLAAHESGPLYRRLPADIRHPLYHRPLVEFMLGLDFRVRRGVGGDRRLQRRALADRLPEVVLTRRSKGSAQELRERHVMESRRWYRAMTEDPRIVRRGWVDAAGWKTEVDRARVGASVFSANFINAVQTELWLQALEREPCPASVALSR